MNKYLTDFEQKIALLSWCLPLKGILNDSRELSAYYWKDNPSIPSLFDIISKEVKRAREILPQWQSKENQKIADTVKEFVLVDDIVQLVCSFAGPPYISLRSVMETEEAKREYPITSGLFLS